MERFLGVLLEAGELRADVGKVLQRDFLRTWRGMREPAFDVFVEFEADSDQPTDAFGVVAGPQRKHGGAGLQALLDAAGDRFLFGLLRFVAGVGGFLFGYLRLGLRGRLLQRCGRVVGGAQKFCGGDHLGALFGDRLLPLGGARLPLGEFGFAFFGAGARRLRGFVERSAAALQAGDSFDRFLADFHFAAAVSAGLFLGALLPLGEQRGHLLWFLGDRAVPGFDLFAHFFERFGLEHLAFAQQLRPLRKDALFADFAPELVACFPEAPVAGGQFARGSQHGRRRKGGVGEVGAGVGQRFEVLWFFGAGKDVGGARQRHGGEMGHSELRRRGQFDRRRAVGTLQRGEDREDPLVAGHQLQARLRGRRRRRQQRLHVADITLRGGRGQFRFIGVHLLQGLLEHEILGAGRDLAQARHVARHEQRRGDFGRPDGDRGFGVRLRGCQRKQEGRKRERH